MSSLGSRFDLYSAAYGEYIADSMKQDSAKSEPEESKKPANPTFTPLIEKQKKRFENLEVRAGDRSVVKTASLLAKHVGSATQD
ncbi:hypothetical protein, partial [Burkholderia sp.]